MKQVIGSICLLMLAFSAGAQGISEPFSDAVAGKQSSGSSPAPFQSAFDRYVESDGIVGAAYIVVRHGKTVEWHNVGMADRDARQTVNVNTIFHWASITKTFTAVAIMQLRDRGKLSLDDSIVKYVPELSKVYSDYGPVSQVTIRQLLSHSAGFQGPTWPYRDDSKAWQPFEPTEWAQLVAMMPYQELAFKPGTRYSYSNPGFIYLARVIEAVSGDPYETYIQKNILTPLSMFRSYFNVTPYSLAVDRSNNYTVHIDAQGQDTVVANGREFDTGITTPNGGLNAPLGDLAKWISFLSATEPSPLYDIILPRASLHEMWQPVVEVNTTPGHVQYLGLSFFLDMRGEGPQQVKFVGHTGQQAGFRSFFVFNPDNGRAIVAAFNTSRADGSDAEKERAKQSVRGFSAVRESALELLR